MSSYPNIFLLHKSRSLRLCAALFFFLLLFGCTSLSESEQAELLAQLRVQDEAAFAEALGQIEDANAEAFHAPLIDLLWADQVGYELGGDSAEITTTLRTLGGAATDDSWEAWLNWYAQTEHNPPAGYLDWKGSLLGELSAEFEEFFIDPVAPSFRPAEVAWGGVAKDGIPSLDYLEQVPIDSMHGYTPADAVFGISINGDHRAYPLRVMDWHEMANDVVGGVPIALTYCTLCGSAIVYRTDHPASDEPLEFGTSGLLYRSNKLMYDRQSNTLWNQLTGAPVMGPQVGEIEQLEIVPIVITTVAAWAEQHPDATILPLETGHIRDYTAGAAYGEYFARDVLRFPVGAVDERLPARTQVFALEFDGEAKAYPLEAFAAQSVINDAVGGQNVVLIAESSNINVYGYSYELEYITYSAGGEIRAFARGDREFERLADGTIVDEAGLAWTVTEAGLVGENDELIGRIPGHVSFWFGWQSFYPETELFEPLE